MIKAILVVWLGFSQTQTLAIDHFDSMAECEAALAALSQLHDKFASGNYVRCLPYSVE